MFAVALKALLAVALIYLLTFAVLPEALFAAELICFALALLWLAARGAWAVFKWLLRNGSPLPWDEF